MFNSRRSQQLVPFNSHPGTSVGVAALVQRRVCFLDSVQGLEVEATTLRAEQTSLPPCGIEGNHHEGDRFSTLCWLGQSIGRDQDCDQKSHSAIVPILQRYAVTSAAFSVPCLKPSSNFGVGDAAVGQSNAIAHGFDLLSPIAFAHVFQLDCWPRRYCFCLCIFVAQESEFHGVNRDG